MVVEMKCMLYEGSPLNYMIIVAKPKEHYSYVVNNRKFSNNNNKATCVLCVVGCNFIQTKISDRRAIILEAKSLPVIPVIPIFNILLRTNSISRLQL